MTNVNWCFRSNEEIEEEAPRRRPVNDAFRRMVHAISGSGRVRMLSRDRENMLVAKWCDEGCQESIAELATAFDPMFLTMAHKVAAHHNVRHLTDDVYQVGQEAFLRALSRYRIDNGNRLSSFIKYSVAGEMTRYALDNRMPMRTGTSVGERNAYYRYRAAIDAFKSEHGRAPGDAPSDLAAVCATLGVATGAFKRARRTHTAQILPIDDVEVWTDPEVHEDPAAIRSLLGREFAALDSVISERDARIARAFLAKRGRKGAAEEVGEDFDLTPERIRQIARDSLRLIRKSLESKGFGSAADVMQVG